MTQHRLNVFIQPEHSKRLDELAAKKGVSKSSIVAAALASWLSPDAADQREAAIAKRLDRLSRHAERLERDQNIAIETLALFIRYFLTVSTPVPEAHQDAARAQGKDIPGVGNIAKLGMSNIVRLQRDLGLSITGAAGMLHGYEGEQIKALNEATGNPFLNAVTTTALYAQAPPIYGGTDQIQRNIIGERVLGLPKEPGDTKNVPFSELPKNA